MVIKYFGPNDKTGVYWPPYTAVEKRQMEADLYRKPHSGPYTVVYPYKRGEGPSLPGRNAALATAATSRRTGATSRPAAEAPQPLPATPATAMIDRQQLRRQRRPPLQAPPDRIS